MVVVRKCHGSDVNAVRVFITMREGSCVYLFSLPSAFFCHSLVNDVENKIKSRRESTAWRRQVFSHGQLFVRCEAQRKNGSDKSTCCTLIWYCRRARRLTLTQIQPRRSARSSVIYLSGSFDSIVWSPDNCLWRMIFFLPLRVTGVDRIRQHRHGDRSCCCCGIKETHSRMLFSCKWVWHVCKLNNNDSTVNTHTRGPAVTRNTHLASSVFNRDQAPSVND